MEMPPTFCRVRYLSTFLYGNGSIATVTSDRAMHVKCRERLGLLLAATQLQRCVLLSYRRT
jgi:hypothetical protein